MKLHRSLFAAACFMGLAACMGCNSTSDAVDDGKGVSEVDINPDIDTLAVGSSMQMRAMLVYADGTTRDVTEDDEVVWNTSNAGIATVSEEGMVEAVAVGLVTVSADFMGEKGEESFAVTP